MKFFSPRARTFISLAIQTRCSETPYKFSGINRQLEDIPGGKKETVESFSNEKDVSTTKNSRIETSREFRQRRTICKSSFIIDLDDVSKDIDDVLSELNNEYSLINSSYENEMKPQQNMYEIFKPIPTSGKNTIVDGNRFGNESQFTTQKPTILTSGKNTIVDGNRFGNESQFTTLKPTIITSTRKDIIDSEAAKNESKMNSIRRLNESNRNKFLGKGANSVSFDDENQSDALQRQRSNTKPTDFVRQDSIIKKNSRGSTDGLYKTVLINNAAKTDLQNKSNDSLNDSSPVRKEENRDMEKVTIPKTINKFSRTPYRFSYMNLAGSKIKEDQNTDRLSEIAQRSFTLKRDFFEKSGSNTDIHGSTNAEIHRGSVPLSSYLNSNKTTLPELKSQRSFDNFPNDQNLFSEGRYRSSTPSKMVDETKLNSTYSSVSDKKKDLQLNVNPAPQTVKNEPVEFIKIPENESKLKIPNGNLNHQKNNSVLKEIPVIFDQKLPISTEKNNYAHLETALKSLIESDTIDLVNRDFIKKINELLPLIQQSISKNLSFFFGCKEFLSDKNVVFIIDNSKFMCNQAHNSFLSFMCGNCIVTRYQEMIFSFIYMLNLFDEINFSNFAVRFTNDEVSNRHVDLKNPDSIKSICLKLFQNPTGDYSLVSNLYNSIKPAKKDNETKGKQDLNNSNSSDYGNSKYTHYVILTSENLPSKVKGKDYNDDVNGLEKILKKYFERKSKNSFEKERKLTANIVLFGKEISNRNISSLKSEKLKIHMIDFWIQIKITETNAVMNAMVSKIYDSLVGYISKQ